MNNNNFPDFNSNEPNYEKLKEKTVENEIKTKINNWDILTNNIIILLESIFKIPEDFSKIIEKIIKKWGNIPYDFLLWNEYKHNFNQILNIAKRYKISTFHKKILIHIISQNYKFIYSAILANSNLSDEEKINKIKESYTEILENNYNFDFRESLSEVVWQIFKIKNFSDILFRKLEYSKEWKLNRNIRIQYIKNHTNLEEIISFVKKCENLWRRFLLSFIKRIEDSIIEWDIKYIEIFDKYYLILQKRLENSLDDNSPTTHAKSEFKKFQEKSKLHNTKYREESVKNKVQGVIEKVPYTTNSKKEINYENDIVNQDELKNLLKKWILYKDIYKILNNKFNNFKIQEIFNILLDNYKWIFITNILSNDFFKNINKEKIIFQYIKHTNSQKLINNLSRLIKIIDYFKIKINKKDFLLRIHKKDYSLFQIVSIIWNTFFNDIALEVENNKWKINEEDAMIFFKYYRSSEKYILQHIWFFNSYRKQFQDKYLIIEENKHIYICENNTSKKTKIKLN